MLKAKTTYPVEEELQLEAADGVDRSNSCRWLFPEIRIQDLKVKERMSAYK